MLRRAFLKLATLAVLHPVLNWQMPVTAIIAEPTTGLTIETWRRCAEALGYFEDCRRMKKVAR